MSDTIEILKKQITDFPRMPGVYLMKDFDGVIIYIGKAKDLRARVRTYFGKGDGRVQIEYLIRRVATIEKIVTPSEEEAFLLERDLINRHKPRYNIRLKDDKAYLSVRVDRNKEWPKLDLTRRITVDGADYYGPYVSGHQLREVLTVIKKVAPLRTCSDTVFYNRQRPCLEYHIKQCAGPCCLPVDKEQYNEWLTQACAILEGEIKPTIQKLEKQMEVASEDLRFEEAAAIRDRVTILKEFETRDKGFAQTVDILDCFGVYREGIRAIVSMLKVRNGRVSDVENFDFYEVHVTDEELLESVIEQFYFDGRELPQEILVPQKLANDSVLSAGFKTQFGRAVKIIVPQKGSKHRLVNLANVNAKQHFSGKFFSESRYEEISKQLAMRFSLKQVPRRIECVDISNFQGSDIVGAVVAFQDGVPDKSGYRRYKIANDGKPNDFESIYQVVQRRLHKKEHLPDLIIIDGGEQQLAKAIQARDELEVPVEIISLAKIRVEKGRTSKDLTHKPERIFNEGATEPINLTEGDEVTSFLQRVRDEVHRFVITFHRSVRGKRVFKSILDDISGVGPERRGRLLRHFGSVEKIRDARVEDIARVGRMPKSLAEKILRALKK